LILENSIDNTLLTQNWNLLNKLHNQLKKIKRKIKNLESNLYDIKPKIKLLVNPKISKWYHNLPYLIYENFLVVWGLNLKTSKKIYQRVQTKSYTYLHVNGYQGTNLFILPKCKDLELINYVASICLVFSKFINTGCSYNSVVISDSVKLVNNKFRINKPKIHLSEIKELYLQIQKDTKLISYSLKPKDFKLKLDLSSCKYELIKKINRELIINYNFSLPCKYLQGILPNKVKYEVTKSNIK
jgi:hypothetical protein